MGSIHASAVLVGARALLIRGPSGAGKSHLILALLRQAECGASAFVRLVADDRCLVEPHHGRLVVRPLPQNAGLVEARGLGIRRLAYEAAAVVGRVIDLAAADGERLPHAGSLQTEIEGITLPRLPVAANADALALIWASLASDPGVVGHIPPARSPLRHKN